jgi:hypothetical protein
VGPALLLAPLWALLLLCANIPAVVMINPAMVGPWVAVAARVPALLGALLLLLLAMELAVPHVAVVLIPVARAARLPALKVTSIVISVTSQQVVCTWGSND